MRIRAFAAKQMINRLERSMPRKLQSIQLQILADLAARTFGADPIRIRRLPPEIALREYTNYTKVCMDVCAGSIEPARIFGEARALGAKVRRLSGLTDPEDLTRLVFLLYRNIGITMRGELPGEITVSRCHFSHFYTPEQCRLMSFTDAGIISGILGGGSLQFHQRITEGCEKCLACFTQETGEV